MNQVVEATKPNLLIPVPLFELFFSKFSLFFLSFDSSFHPSFHCTIHSFTPKLSWLMNISLQIIQLWVIIKIWENESKVEVQIVGIMKELSTISSNREIMDDDM